MSARLRVAVAALALLGVACASLLGALSGRRDRIKLPHQRHQDAKVDCLACHEDIFDAESLAQRNLPREKKCLECHKEQKEKGNCGFCHTEPESPGTYPHREVTLVLSHQKHLELEEIDENCRTCHVELPEPGRPAAPPPMASCTGCHRHQEEYLAGGCRACHLDLGKFPLRPVSTFSHRDDYVRTHAAEARARGAACATCHEQSFCAECHSRTAPVKIEALLPERVDRAFIHRGDFVGRHAIEASADPAMCSRCHGTSFCQECHDRRGLLSQADPARNPHPPGFADPRAAVFHGPAARRDINSCAACHDRGASSSCVQCHRVGGVGGNPHPASWLLRHDRAELDRNPMCLACHP